MSSSTPEQNNGERMSILKDAIKESEMKLVNSRGEVAALKKELADVQALLQDALNGIDNATTSNQLFKPPTNKTCHNNNEQPKVVKLDSGSDFAFLPKDVAAKLQGLNGENIDTRRAGSAVLHYCDKSKTVHCTEKEEEILLALIKLIVENLTKNPKPYISFEREYYYIIKMLVDNQDELEKYFKVIAQMVDVPVAALAMCAAPKGEYIGRVAIERNGMVFNAADETIIANNARGFAVPHDLILYHLKCLENREEITLISDAKLILLVEDYGCYNALLYHEFYNRVPCIMVHSNGNGVYDTVAWVNFLHEQLKIPVVSVGDMNYGNIKLFKAYGKSNSRALYCKYLGALNTPILWWGVRHKHIDEKKLICRRNPNGIQAKNWDGKICWKIDNYLQDMDDPDANKKNLESLLKDDDFLEVIGGNKQARIDEINNQIDTPKKMESEAATPESLVNALEEDLVTFLYNKSANVRNRNIRGLEGFNAGSYFDLNPNEEEPYLVCKSFNGTPGTVRVYNPTIVQTLPNVNSCSASLGSGRSVTSTASSWDRHDNANHPIAKRTKRRLQLLTTINAHDHSVIRMLIGGGGKGKTSLCCTSYLATVSSKGTTIRLFGLPRGDYLWEWHRGKRACQFYSLSWGGSESDRLASYGSSGTIHIFDWGKKKEPKVMKPDNIDDEDDVDNDFEKVHDDDEDGPRKLVLDSTTSTKTKPLLRRLSSPLTHRITGKTKKAPTSPPKHRSYTKLKYKPSVSAIASSNTKSQTLVVAMLDRDESCSVDDSDIKEDRLVLCTIDGELRQYTVKKNVELTQVEDVLK